MTPSLQGQTLLIAAEDARPLADDEYFLHDLVGLEVRSQADERALQATPIVTPDSRR